MKKLLGLLAVAPMALAACGGEAAVETTPTEAYGFTHKGYVTKAIANMDGDKVHSVNIDETYHKIDATKLTYEAITDAAMIKIANDALALEGTIEFVRFDSDTCYSNTAGVLAEETSADQAACETATFTWVEDGDFIVGAESFVYNEDGTAVTNGTLVNDYDITALPSAKQTAEKATFSKADSQGTDWEYFPEGYFTGAKGWQISITAIEKHFEGKTKEEVAALAFPDTGITGATMNDSEDYFNVVKAAVANA